MPFFRSDLPKYSEEEIDQLVQPILEEVLKRTAPMQVILFGSAVAGNFDERSDLDFTIVLEDGDSVAAATKALYRIRHQTNVGLDFVVVTETRFNEMKDLGGVLFIAHHDGKLLYPRNPFATK